MPSLGRRIVGREVKASAAPTARDAAHLSWLAEREGSRLVAGAVLHTGPGVYPLADGVIAMPIRALWQT